ncbi:MAG TPA: Rrf2 family transcriptional regulator [Dehalococcoidia bacterium]|nr:Rrf2 family transcriptional regulator [Dehalococcoidia bacterium]
MRLSSKGDYATRVLMELAVSEGPQPLSAHDLSTRTGISQKYLEQIMIRLRDARLVSATRGAHGGYELARRPEQISVGEVVRLMDGPLAPSPCASESAHVPCPVYRCPSEKACVLRGLWQDVRQAISGVLDGTTFADLVRRQRESEPAAARYRI